MPVWKKSGRLVLASAPYIKANMDDDMPQVIIDLRPAREAEKGHIPGAVSIEAKNIASIMERFPTSKGAPIILYGSDDAEAKGAFGVVRKWDYKNTAILPGGMDAWGKAGFKAEKGKLATEIVYVPKPAPGEIPVNEFRKIVDANPSDKMIIDVRGQEEAHAAKLKNSVNIPTMEMKKRLAEIPKDKEIILHCNTGVLAELGYNILKDEGYNVRYLRAKIAIGNDGSYELSKEE